MLLTEQEIMDINQNAEFDSAIGYARAIEAKLLEKLKAQSDIGFVVDNATCVTTTIRRNDDVGMLAYGTRLYAHPLPPDDVVRDAARYKWLRDSAYCTYPAVFKACQAWNTLRGETLDAAIDAAMKEMK